MSSELRLGLAGAQFGEKHAAAFSQVDGVILAAIAIPMNPGGKPWLTNTKFERAFDTYDEMLEYGDLDAVVICLPTALHERSVSAAFDAGLHVLCEKPPAVSESEMSKIVSSAGFCGKTYMWARQQRFSPAIAKAREIIERGEIGDAYRGSHHGNGLGGPSKTTIGEAIEKTGRGLAGHRYPHDRFSLVSYGLS